MFSTVDLTTTQWAVGLACATVLGISKAGVKGIAIATIPLMAMVFGSKASTGIVLPMLMMGDIFAIIYFRRYVRREYLIRLMPGILVGVLVAVWTGDRIPEHTFRLIMGCIILASVLIIVWNDRRKSERVPTHWTFSTGMGLMTGYSTMIGNLAGAFSNLYFLSQRLVKNEFIGTGAWLFFLVNWFKLPFHIFVWETISVESLAINLRFMPGTLVGLFLGVRILRYITDGLYRKLLLGMTALGALLMFL